MVKNTIMQDKETVSSTGAISLPSGSLVDSFLCAWTISAPFSPRVLVLESGKRSGSVFLEGTFFG